MKGIMSRLRKSQFLDTLLFGASIFSGFMMWKLISLSNEFLFPPPEIVLVEAWDLILSGSLPTNAGASLLRIAFGFVIGGALAIPVGLVMGVNEFIRRALEPYVHFFRFIPAIAMIALAVIWFGIGETGKVFLIAFNTFFIVAMNIESGVHAVAVNRIRAARSLGAGKLRVFFSVIAPSTVPFILTGLRLSMGRSFATVVAAEMLAARAGLGFFLWDSRIFMESSNILIALLALAFLGFVIEKLLKILTLYTGGEYVKGVYD